jgi:hypothetical protein
MPYSRSFLEKEARRRKYFTFLKNRFQRYFNGLRRAGCGPGAFPVFFGLFRVARAKKAVL